MIVVIKTGNAIKHNSLKDRRFQQYLQELKFDYGDVLYFSKIRWPSRGKCLEHFWNLKDEIKNFMKKTALTFLNLMTTNGFLICVFFADITKKLNKLNSKLERTRKIAYRLL